MPEASGESRVDPARVDAAIAQVLQAERDARAQVEQCARDAESLLEQAHELARQLARRAAQRSARVQRWSAATLQSRLDELAGQQARIAHSSTGDDAPEPLRRAVETLAAQLTEGGR
jgi:vacuolar-type H+-ATPase subunit H